MDGVELQVLVKLGVVLLLIFPTLWVLRRLMGGPAGGWRQSIHVLESRPLADGQRLYLVRIHDRHLLLGGSKQAVSLLTEIEAPPEPEAMAAEGPMGWDEAVRSLRTVYRRCLASLGARLHAGRPEAR